jgi:hypothetical protein
MVEILNIWKRFSLRPGVKLEVGAWDGYASSVPGEIIVRSNRTEIGGKVQIVPLIYRR